MKKRKIAAPLLLACYALPYAFAALYGDREWDTVLLYGMLFGCTGILGCICGRMGRIKLGLAGNLLSAAVSGLCAWSLWQGENGYFKPFGAVGWVGFLSVVSLMIQYLLWYRRTQKEPWQSLLAAVCAVSLVLLAAVLLLLLWNARQFGAIG